MSTLARRFLSMQKRPNSNEMASLMSQSLISTDEVQRGYDNPPDEATRDERSVTRTTTLNQAATSWGMNLESVLPKTVADLQSFALHPAPRNMTIRCCIDRKRIGIGGRIYPIYCLWMEKEDGNKVFLMAARKKIKSMTSNYLISTDQRNLSINTNSCIGKLRSNFLGTKFTVYAGGGKESVRQELAAICYETNVLGFKGPRKMTVIVPGMLGNNQRVSICPKHEFETLLSCHANNNTEQLVTLENKSPRWDEQIQSYVLNFHGRVTQGSVKNFQIIHPKDEDYIVMQFGRVEEDMFSMDYSYPMCALQAFAITLSSFDGKLACE